MWGRVEHELFCFNSGLGFRGAPVSMEAAVRLIGGEGVLEGLDRVCVRDDVKFDLELGVSIGDGGVWG
ncbi:MAG: hypothetical protein LBE76_02640 [Nitrososphaerota archaeon]|nr:hypothetical protein [Nitrososphaerota archaeon]